MIREFRELISVTPDYFLAEKEENVIFGGRLGQYKYFDMAPIIEVVFNLDI